MSGLSSQTTSSGLIPLKNKINVDLMTVSKSSIRAQDYVFISSGTQLPKMAKFAMRAAQTGVFHHAVKYQTLVALRSSYYLRIPEVWCLPAEWKYQRRALRCCEPLARGSSEVNECKPLAQRSSGWRQEHILVDFSAQSEPVEPLDRLPTQCIRQTVLTSSREVDEP